MTQEAGKSNEETAENIGYIIQAKNVLFRLSIAINDEGEKINYPEYLKDEIQAAIANLDLLVEKKKIASQQREQPWVRVSDRLPEIPEPYYDADWENMITPCTINCLVYDSVEKCVYEKSFGIIAWDKDITHWMPLPAPPKEIK